MGQERCPVDNNKIDSLATDGLAGVSNSLAYRVHEVEKHLHTNERWFEVAGTPDAEVHVADRIGTSGASGSFQIDAGNDTWGSWVQILGSDDTPAESGNAKYDIHKMLITASESAGEYFIQVAVGTSGAAALAAQNFTEMVYKPVTGDIHSSPLGFTNVRHTAGEKAWVRCMVPGVNTATLNFYFGLHEYEG